jgi:hypothetical protein
MSNFRLLTRTRQITEYSCGASALQAVLSYWGHDLDETAIMKIIGTSEDVGTYPENIVRGVRALGLEAEARDNLTLDEVRRFGHPVIALAQVWRSQRSSAPRPEDDWDNGHYIVLLGVDEDYVYFQDPYLRMGKAFVTRGTFERHWHQIMGGEAAGNPRLEHLGVLIRAEPPARVAATGPATPEQLDFARLGSLNLMVTEYPRVMLPFDFLDELRELWASSAVRPDAFVQVCKDADGNLSAMEGGRLEGAEDAPEINALLAAIASRRAGAPESAAASAEAARRAAAAGDFGLSVAHILAIAAQMPTNHTVIIVLFENVWERGFREVVHKYGGELRNQVFIAPEELVARARELGIQ